MGQKIKNAILLTITRIAAVVLIVSICCVDSASIIPIVAFLLSMTWLVLFAYANNDNAEELIRKSWLLK